MYAYKSSNSGGSMSNKFDALVSILNWIEGGQTVTPHSICEQLSITSRTTYRYLQTLEGAGFPIFFDKRRGSYRFMEGFTLRRPHLDVQESLALALARVSLAGMNAGLDAKLRGIEEKLAVRANGLPEHVIIATDQFTSDVSEIFNTLNNSIVEHCSVAFDYHAASTRQTTRREVDPYYLYFGDGIWTMRGWCHTRGELRAFALDRISGLNMLQNRFEAPDIKPKTDHDGTFGRFISGNLVKVKLVFYGAAIQAVNRKTWHTSQQSRMRDDGSLEMTFTVNGILGIRPWIYRWLPLVKVEEPQELVEMVKRELGEAIDRQKI
jgi:predicted DNA-binding transcriptional regulator YafY